MAAKEDPRHPSQRAKDTDDDDAKDDEAAVVVVPVMTPVPNVVNGPTEDPNKGIDPQFKR